MKTLIICESQARKLNELLDFAGSEDMPQIDLAVDNPADVTSVGKEATQKIKSVGAKAAKVRVFPKGSKISDTLELSGSGETVSDQLKNAAETSAESGMDPRKTSFTATYGNGEESANESKTFTKRQIEEARYHKLNKGDVKMAKKDFTSWLMQL